MSCTSTRYIGLSACASKPLFKSGKRENQGCPRGVINSSLKAEPSYMGGMRWGEEGGCIER